MITSSETLDRRNIGITGQKYKTKSCSETCFATETHYVWRQKLSKKKEVIFANLRIREIRELVEYFN